MCCKLQVALVNRVNCVVASIEVIYVSRVRYDSERIDQVINKSNANWLRTPVEWGIRSHRNATIAKWIKQINYLIFAIGSHQYRSSPFQFSSCQWNMDVNKYVNRSRIPVIQSLVPGVCRCWFFKSDLGVTIGFAQISKQRFVCVLCTSTEKFKRFPTVDALHLWQILKDQIDSIRSDLLNA